MPWDQGPGLWCPSALVPGFTSKETMSDLNCTEDIINNYEKLELSILFGTSKIPPYLILIFVRRHEHSTLG